MRVNESAFAPVPHGQVKVPTSATRPAIVVLSQVAVLSRGVPET